jgi:hypothetical protein
VSVGSSRSSIPFSISLSLKPGFEQIDPKAPVRPSIPDPKRARDYAFNRMAAQGSRRDTK